MLERELEIKFIGFLLRKGYSENNLQSHLSIKNDKGISRPDLIIVDIINNEYIGIIEFKNRYDKNIEDVSIGQFFKFFSYLGTQDIPAFLVIPIKNDDFQIFEFTKNNLFKPILKVDFPTFEVLSARRITEEKIKNRKLFQKEIYALENKQKKSKISAYFSILSLIIGVVTSIIAVSVQQKNFKINKNSRLFHNENADNQCDDLYRKIVILEADFKKFSKLCIKKNNIIIHSDISSLDKRVEIIEKGISENPEKALSILQVRQEIELLKKEDEYSKEITQSKLDVIKKEIEVQNSWMLGILITIFGTILSFAIPNLLSRKN